MESALEALDEDLNNFLHVPDAQNVAREAQRQLHVCERAFHEVIVTELGYIVTTLFLVCVGIPVTMILLIRQNRKAFEHSGIPWIGSL